MAAEWECEVWGHVWASGLMAAGVIPIKRDWCARCGILTEPIPPGIIIKGQRREVEDVDPPAEFL